MRQFLLGLGLLAILALAGCGDDTPREPPAGFAGLGTSIEGYQEVEPGMGLDFPEDHGAHPDVRLEWWYLTANLEDDAGEPLGVLWTLFRQSQSPPAERASQASPWSTEQIWMGHMAVSRGRTHRVAERFARSPSRAESDQAGVTIAPFQAWLDDWELSTRVEDPSTDSFQALSLSAHQDDPHGGFGYRLDLIAEGPLVRHGEAGFSQKTADGKGSMYYSQPFYRVEGEVTLDGETRRVSGRGWLDREWSSQMLEPRQTGWDWISLHLADGRKLMAYRLRGGGDQGEGDYLFGNLISPQGVSTSLGSAEISLTPLATSTVAGRDLPTRWRLEVPSHNLDLEVEAPHANRWMDTSVAYWEGEVIARDRESGQTLGEGYLEMTGY